MTEPTDPDAAAGDEQPPRFAVRRIVRAPKAEQPDRQASQDETDLGWGDAPGGRDDDWYRRERPPHHG